MAREKIRKAVASLAGHNVLIIGDLMLDHYLMGTVDRISPEAPVPVVNVREESVVLGGAGNVGRNIADLGGSPLLVTVVGDDRDGCLLDDLCEKAGLKTRIVRDVTRPTTKKTRVIAHNQQVVRVDHELVAPLSDATQEALFTTIESVVQDYPVIILSDYGKGLISRSFMDRFMVLIETCSPRPKVLVDPKTVNYDLYTGVDLLTPNTKEAGEGASMAVSDKASVLKAGEVLFDRLQCTNLLVTLGPDGMALFEGRDTVHHIPTFAQKVFDVTGAGDTVIATTALALSAGVDLLTACTLANYAAGVVVGQVGAATTTPAELLESMDELPEPDVSLWTS
ncbi:D-glycero-beta-D-manno-heptose-7-phosphate kinase [Pseudodesulfovibrio sp. JC047]|uniref:D-glycero-beta-D-manno-heptose-7-phosphate kinase n=1 Tax=Pseudodesulfovibrio sp. JC047 TaxID=2683199 RepID=UPI0013D6F5FE|nr:D-glycero-beta-D-manno-heptose-7-phosphate kinase [Pseudodesulfovibrio sp. JC047]NDV19981.1 D-glycero-beta-D-manno-heptose-7-phosphate kinase [Pseudodesulfovibrio sp. JC047]